MKAFRKKGCAACRHWFYPRYPRWKPSITFSTGGTGGKFEVTLPTSVKAFRIRRLREGRILRLVLTAFIVVHANAVPSVVLSLPTDPRSLKTDSYAC